MDVFIKNILARLQQFSKNLDEIESFVDKTWSFYGEGGVFYTYRFLKEQNSISNNIW